MSVPTPKAMDTKLVEIRDLAIEVLRAGVALREPYRWAYHYGLQPSVTGDGGGSTQVAYSDPTGGVVESQHKARARAACVDATRALDDACNGLRDTLHGLDYASGQMTGPKHGVMPKASVWDHIDARKDNRGSFVSAEQLEESKAKQKARQLAGEGYGET